MPDKETAIKIAEVILFRLYGEEDIIAERPYKVKEEDDIWWISGTLKENEFGSAFSIAISKQTGAVFALGALADGRLWRLGGRNGAVLTIETS